MALQWGAEVEILFIAIFKVVVVADSDVVIVIEGTLPCDASGVLILEVPHRLARRRIDVQLVLLLGEAVQDLGLDLLDQLLCPQNRILVDHLGRTTATIGALCGAHVAPGWLLWAHRRCLGQGKLLLGVSLVERLRLKHSVALAAVRMREVHRRAVREILFRLVCLECLLLLMLRPEQDVFELSDL